MLFLTKYKTIKCQHFIKQLPCPTEHCDFAHGRAERRRDPLSPFFVSYDSTLCSTYKSGVSGTCAHGKGCLHSSNMMEWLYHPENYRTRLCSIFGEHCPQYPVCDRVHNRRELKKKVTMEDTSLPLGFFARSQMWDKVIEGIARLPDTEQPLLKEAYPSSHETVLHYAAKYCRPDVILALLKKIPKLDMNPRDIFGQTPLHKTVAYAGGRDEHCDWQQTIDLLIEKKADPLLKDYRGNDVFFFANKNTATIHLRSRLADRFLK
jgi:Ankyrin repeats (many copies)